MAGQLFNLIQFIFSRLPEDCCSIQQHETQCRSYVLIFVTSNVIKLDIFIYLYIYIYTFLFYLLSNVYCNKHICTMYIYIWNNFIILLEIMENNWLIHFNHCTGTVWFNTISRVMIKRIQSKLIYQGSQKQIHIQKTVRKSAI